MWSIILLFPGMVVEHLSVTSIVNFVGFHYHMMQTKYTHNTPDNTAPCSHLHKPLHIAQIRSVLMILRKQTTSSTLCNNWLPPKSYSFELWYFAKSAIVYLERLYTTKHAIHATNWTCESFNEGLLRFT